MTSNIVIGAEYIHDDGTHWFPKKVDDFVFCKKADTEEMVSFTKNEFLNKMNFAIKSNEEVYRDEEYLSYRTLNDYAEKILNGEIDLNA